MKSAFFAGALMVASSAAFANDMETVQEYRHAVYESIGGHMGSIVQIVRNGYRMGDLEYHANAMAGLSKITPDLFPEGSGGGDTEALPEIWEDPDGFAERMQDFVDAADAFAAAAASGDMGQIGGGLQQLGRSCKGCHDNYRAD